ncbi:8534_t:CDS:2 [Gigaspora margarita]|uniref:8534_t:CDS:1 n=1 Tax=Gigaspora margarita TaxID=4874 RepID=A0ABN7WH10_GIGMA|nr:8534_t:CDS:2 [Gigaspora margarita]
MPDTPDNFNNIITYLQHKTFAEKYDNPAKKSNFQRRCKNFVYDQQSSYLFFEQSSKDDNSLPTKKRVVPIYDSELREALLEKFHVGAHEAHKKSPYEAFFGFKMYAVYNIPEDITLEDVALEDVTLENIAPEDIAPEDIIAPENITKKIILAATQDNYNQASYEFHAMQVKRVHKKVAQNNETYRNKLVICRSVHRRKVVFEPGDKVAIIPDFDNNQKTRK